MKDPQRMKRLIAGPRAVEEAVRSHPHLITVLYHDPEVGPAVRALLTLAEQRKVRIEPRSRAELQVLSRGLRDQGILAIAGEYPYVGLEALLEPQPHAPLLVALDQIQDPHNLGAIVRSAVAFKADGVITLKDRAAPVTPVTVRASAGATEQARIARVTNLARTLGELRKRGLQIVGLAGEGTSALIDVPFESPGRVLVIGSEGSGLRPLVRKQCDHLARIDLPGPIASLNASVAAGIAIFVSQQQRAEHGRPQA